MGMGENAAFKPIAFRNIAVHENDGWFCDIYYDGLFHIDLRTGMISLEFFFGTNQIEAYSPIAYYEEKLIIAPRNADSILIYDIVKKHAERIRLNMSENYVGNDLLHFFSAIEVYGRYAYIFPGRYHAIIRINLENYEIKYIEGWYSQIKSILPQKTEAKRVIFCDWVEKVGENRFVLVCWQTNLIMLFDAGTEKYQFIRIGLPDKALASVIYKENEKVVSYRDENLLTIFPERREVDLSEYNEKGGVCIFDIGAKWFATSIAGGRVIVIDKETERKEIYIDFSENQEEVQEPPYYMSCRKKVEDKCIILSVITNGKVAIIDIANNHVAMFDLKLSDVDKQSIVNYRQNLKLKSKRFLETERFTLKDLVGTLKHDKIMKFADSEFLPCGELIFSELKKEM